MKRTFLEYILFFERDNGQYGNLARKVRQDGSFPVMEQDHKAIYTYMDTNPYYDCCKAVTIELYVRYLRYADPKRQTKQVL